MQKGLLRVFSPGHELQVINEQDVYLSVVFLEGLHAFLAQGPQQLTHEVLGRQVHDVPPRVMLANMMRNGLQEVRLP
jgi:hypothetical protein